MTCFFSKKEAGANGLKGPGARLQWRYVVTGLRIAGTLLKTMDFREPISRSAVASMIHAIWTLILPTQGNWMPTARWPKAAHWQDLPAATATVPSISGMNTVTR